MKLALPRALRLHSILLGSLFSIGCVEPVEDPPGPGQTKDGGVLTDGDGGSAPDTGTKLDASGLDGGAEGDSGTEVDGGSLSEDGSSIRRSVGLAAASGSIRAKSYQLVVTVGTVSSTGKAGSQNIVLSTGSTAARP